MYFTSTLAPFFLKIPLSAAIQSGSFGHMRAKLR